MIKCPCCKGKYSYIDVITDGRGPEELCGFCKEGKVNIFRWIYWKFSEKFLWKTK